MIHKNLFFVIVLSGAFSCSYEEKSMLRELHRQKNLDFFEKELVILGNFEWYVSPRKSPEFMTVSV